MNHLLTPESWTDDLRGRTRFAFGPSGRLVLWGVATIGLAACGYAVARSAYPAFNPVWAAALSGLISLGGVAIAAWQEQIEFRFDEARVIRRRGFYPLLRHTNRPLSDAVALTLENVERKDSSGLPVVRSNLILEFVSGERIPLLRGCADDRIETLALALADRIEVPLRTAAVPLSVRRPPRLIPRLITGALWAAMFSVAVFTATSLVRTARSRPNETGVQQQLLPSPAIEPYRTGVAQYYAREYVKAEASFNDALRRSPTSAEIWNMLAYSQAEQGHLDQALESAHQAVKLAPEEGYIIDTLAEMYERRKEYEPASKMYFEALKRMDPATACETHTKCARTLIAFKRPNDAVGHLLEALRYPDPQWEALAKTLLHRIAPNEAVPTPIRPFGGRSFR